MPHRIRLYLWAVFALGLLAACGSASAPGTPAPTAISPSRVPNLPPPATAPSMIAAPALAATQPAQVTAATQPTATTGEPSIAQALTPEGYHVLGNTDAPVTLVMYSDFL
jgi:protein-disulfide isomerase